MYVLVSNVFFLFVLILVLVLFLLICIHFLSAFPASI